MANFVACQGGAMPCHQSPREAIERRTTMAINRFAPYRQPEPRGEPKGNNPNWLGALYAIPGGKP